MFRMGRESFMDRVISNDFAEMIKEEEELGEEQIEVSSIDRMDEKDRFLGGSVLTNINQNMKSFESAAITTKVITKRDQLINDRYPKLGHYDYLFQDVIRSITTVNNSGSFIESVKTAYKIKEALGDSLYGILLKESNAGQESSNVINPFHPLVAMEATSNKYFKKKINYNMFVYTYNNKEAMDKRFSTDKADPELVVQNINDIINMYASDVTDVTTTVRQKISSVNRKAGNIIISSEEAIDTFAQFKRNSSSVQNNKEEYLIVAHQILTEGVVAPYYGTSIVRRKGGSTTGMNISPFMSCNISTDKIDDIVRFKEGKEFDSKYATDNNIKVVPQYYSVCTGGTPNNTLKGLRTLSHSNASSPYNRYTIMDGALAYAAACIEKSIEIYKFIDFIPKEEEPKEEPKEEFQPEPQPQPKQEKKKSEAKKKLTAEDF